MSRIAHAANTASSPVAVVESCTPSGLGTVRRGEPVSCGPPADAKPRGAAAFAREPERPQGWS
ncbi:hypothetical protein J2S50_001001 [Streptomyces sp. DSM 40167]|nr:hypothetical protein [Streptomyces sp. DSM 40167]